MLNSHFQTLAKTNCPLTDAELRDVRALRERLATARARQLELIGLPFPLAFRQMCLAEEERIAGDLSTCRALLDPIRKLPVGVIAKILAFYPLSSDSAERHIEVSRLGQISSRWRRAALSVPFFWTTLRLILPDATNPTYADARLYMIDWFARAGPAAPLALHIDVRTPIHDDAILRVEGLDVLVRLVSPYLGRLRYLSLGQAFRRNVLLPFLAQTQFKNLGSLVLSAPGDAPSTQTLDVSNGPLLSEVLPNLRRVKFEQELFMLFNSSSHSVAPKDFSLPFNRLTHLTLESVDVKGWIKAMQDCIMLQFGVFHLRGTIGACDILLDGGKSLLSYLMDLTLTFEGCVNPTVFDLLDTPVLSTLRIGSSMPDDLNLWGPRASGMFAQMSKLLLLALVRAWPIHVEVFHQLLEHAPYVTELEMELNADIAPFFDALQDRTPVLQSHVPRLTAILVDMVIYYALSPTTIADFPLDGFLDFLESRAGTLKRCRLYIDGDEVHHVVRERFRRVVNKSTSGVSVSLTSQHEMKGRGWRRRLPNPHTSAVALAECE